MCKDRAEFCHCQIRLEAFCRCSRLTGSASDFVEPPVLRILNPTLPIIPASLVLSVPKKPHPKYRLADAIGRISRRVPICKYQARLRDQLFFTQSAHENLYDSQY